MNYHRLLHLVISLGATLLENGAETYRVEESILRIFQGLHNTLPSDELHLG